MLKKLLLIILIHCFYESASCQIIQAEQRELRRKNNNPFAPPTEKTKGTEVYKFRGYTDSTQLIYTSMATCKMACIQVEDKDVRAVLKEGMVNIKRSKLTNSEKSFAVEYDNGKKLRVIVAPKGYALTVITVNPIDYTAECDCNK